MQPLNDDELRGLLRQWKAPSAPPSIEKSVLAAAEPSAIGRFFRWIAAGSIRVPVPVGIGAVILLLVLAFQASRQPKPPETNFSQFQPVKELKPRIIRSSYEAN
jgi:hypothetical protein